jgi:hypothetical protein
VQFTIFLRVFVAFLHATNCFLKGRLAELVRLNGLVFFILLKARLNLGPCISDSNGWLQALDPRSQSIHSATLVAIGGMFFILVASDCFLLNALEKEFENVRVDLCSATVGRNDRTELIKCCFSGNLKSFILFRVSIVNH